MSHELSFGFGLREIGLTLAGRTLLALSVLLSALPVCSNARADHLLSQVSDAGAQNTKEIIALEPGKAIERELGGAQEHSYQLTLAEGEYASVIVEQRGIDVVARLYGADGKLIAEFDAEMRRQGQEMAELVADSAGNYRVEIVPKYKRLPAGRYEVRLGELRAATGQDRSLNGARRMYAESARLSSAGRFAEAQPLGEQALEIRQRELGAEHAETARALNQLARIYDNLGDYDRAEQTNQRALHIREKTLEPDHPDIALSLHNLAITYLNREEYPKALTFHRRALEIRERVLGMEHPAVAVSLINLGAVYNYQGDNSRAIELYERALAIQERVFEGDNLNTIVIMNNLAKVYVNQGDYTRAEPMLLRAVSGLERLFGADNVRMADPLGNLANLYGYLGDYEKAETYYLRVLDLRKKGQGAIHPMTAQAIHNLGSFYFFKGDYEKSELLLRQALEMRETLLGADNPAVSRTLNVLSRLLAMKGDAVQAVDLQKRANAIAERDMALNFAIGSERQKLAYLTILTEQNNQTISTHIRSAANLPAAAQLAATMILQRKGRILDATSASLTALRQRFNLEDQALLNRLIETNTQLAEMVLTGPQKRSLAEYQKQITLLEVQREKLESEIGSRSAGFFASSEPIKLASVQAAIPVNAAVIEFAAYQPFDPKASRYDEYYGPHHYVAYIIRREGEVKWKELGSAKAIDDAVAALRRSLRDPKRGDVQRLARVVDEKVMQPIRALTGDASHFLISPDGALNLIPFEALVDEQNRYLLERYSFTYLTSGRDLLRLQKARESKSGPMVVANPWFGEPEIAQVAKAARKERSFTAERKRQSVTSGTDLAGLYFAPLAGTAQEAAVIKSLFPEVHLLTGAQATESAIKQVNSPLILHIATHGFFLQDAADATRSGVAKDRSTQAIRGSARIENPLLRSGLALAGANLRDISGDDGILTALEASGLNLWGTKLVTLSACDTGVGEVLDGEGVYGLRRAFVLAGTETLVMSMWPVSDYVTREMMTSYYKGLKQGEGRGAALRQAQLSMQKRKDRQHPFYWASFIQSGEWANLDGKR